MGKTFIHNAKKNIALILLGFFAFSFLHSEVNFLNFDDSNHSTHDYCEIVKNTVASSKTLLENLPKAGINKDICVFSIDDNNSEVVLSFSSILDEHQVFKQSSKAYLFNKTFLI